METRGPAENHRPTRSHWQLFRMPWSRVEPGQWWQTDSSQWQALHHKAIRAGPVKLWFSFIKLNQTWYSMWHGWAKDIWGDKTEYLLFYGKVFILILAMCERLHQNTSYKRVQNEHIFYSWLFLSSGFFFGIIPHSEKHIPAR